MATHGPSEPDFRRAEALLQAIEVGPVDGKNGPGLLLLKGIPSTSQAFLEWFDAAEWLRRCVTRVYLFPVEEETQCAPTLKELLRKVVDATHPHLRAAPLRLQCSPRSNEMDAIVCPSRANACIRGKCPSCHNSTTFRASSLCATQQA